MNNTVNPVFTYTVTGYVNGDTASVLGGGAPTITTTALPGSPIGTYPITPSQSNIFTTANYTFAFVPGILTITSGGPSPDFSFSATPQVLTIPAGQTRQATLTLTPSAYFEGIITPSCGNLAANVSCTFSPAAFNADGTGNAISVTLTVNTDSATTIVGAVSSEDKSGISQAAIFLLPGGLTGLWLAFNRRKLRRLAGAHYWLVGLVLFSGLLGLSACGGHSSSTSGIAQAGRTNVVVTATGTPANGSGSVSHTLNVSVTVQPQ